MLKCKLDERHLGELDHVSGLPGFAVLAFTFQGISKKQNAHTKYSFAVVKLKILFNNSSGTSLMLVFKTYHEFYPNDT